MRRCLPRRRSRKVSCQTPRASRTPLAVWRALRDFRSTTNRQETNMAVNVVMPQMGESIFEGTVTKWLKKPGDKIERDEPLFEISTDKVDAEIPAPAAGVLKEIKVKEGQTVPIQTVVAVIDVAGSAAA